MAFIMTPPNVLNGNKIRTETDGESIHTPVTMIGDRFDPTLRQSVDNRGAGKIAFNNGEPDFTAFGRTTITESNMLGVYKFYEQDYQAYFHKVEETNGTVTRDAVNYGMKLTNTTESGSLSGYFTHRFFSYRPGNSMPLTFTSKCGDSGKANLERRAGWFGNNRDVRMCFLFNENGLNIEVYDPVVGMNSVVNQSNFTGDRLDGSGGDNNLSGATFDATKSSIWWIDFQFLGAGAVRFGTWVNGKKVLCHVEGHYNELDRPYMSEANLSFGFEQKNNGLTSSTSEMHCFCAVIQNDGYDEFDRTTVAISATKTLNTTSFVPIMSYRPTEMRNGYINRTRLVPMIETTHNEGTVGIEVIAEVNTGLVNATWANSESAVEYDTSADSIAYNGLRKAGTFVSSNYCLSENLDEVFPIQTTGITRHFDHTTSDHVTVLARLVKQGGADESECCVSVIIAEVE